MIFAITTSWSVKHGILLGFKYGDNNMLDARLLELMSWWQWLYAAQSHMGQQWIPSSPLPPGLNASWMSSALTTGHCTLLNCTDGSLPTSFPGLFPFKREKPWEQGWAHCLYLVSAQVMHSCGKLSTDSCISHADARRRNSFKNQPELLKWNLLKLAEAIQDALPLHESSSALEELLVYWHPHCYTVTNTRKVPQKDSLF